ncbi:hypothetical protein Pmar_PMAR006056 [Perkinsus marinus ATCC 50983]|uniref:Uncharacterized protein n=1 Tax=Perkinsus marinus (strain ATCC 50983 / TXsc) TaxID=423536 RepID=C5LA35_PERM5|nr:hypothetical protein Pmar_PMAR006056 [Perkinsus marinus ATCC 50983]EER06291.1 hypothetical protein Pmar_PMAR006056 [Perkinsus marinus ATCC 50983]|eukprot:XP_002774475.1 hypothetical protein Pmar_PMAR006056 [Perkinsus marinus ATCC 50983]
MPTDHYHPVGQRYSPLTAASSAPLAGRRVAVIGSGLAGLTTAWALCSCVGSAIEEVTVYERADKLGLYTFADPFGCAALSLLGLRPPRVEPPVDI